MIIDSKGKFFGKISFIDILIVIVIVGAAIGLYYKFTKTHNSQDLIKIQFTLYSESVPEYAVKSIEVGDVVKDLQQNRIIGKVTSIKISSAVTFNANSTGKVVKSSKPGYVSVQITVEGNAVYSETGFTIIKGVNYYINRSLNLAFGQSQINASITSYKSK